MSRPAAAKTTLTKPQARLLRGLRNAGGSGVFDRYVRVVAGGEAVSAHGSPTPVNCFRAGWIKMKGARVAITAKGLAALVHSDLAAEQKKEDVGDV